MVRRGEKGRCEAIDDASASCSVGGKTKDRSEQHRTAANSTTRRRCWRAGGVVQNERRRAAGRRVARVRKQKALGRRRRKARCGSTVAGAVWLGCETAHESSAATQATHPSPHPSPARPQHPARSTQPSSTPPPCRTTQRLTPSRARPAMAAMLRGSRQPHPALTQAHQAVIRLSCTTARYPPFLF
jgi:hypothetical protein